jgi:hypothetical protein
LRQRQRFVRGDAARGDGAGNRGDGGRQITRRGDFGQSELDRLTAPHAKETAEAEAASGVPKSFA